MIALSDVAPAVALMMEAVSTLETSVTFCETTRRNIPEGRHLQEVNLILCLALGFRMKTYRNCRDFEERCFLTFGVSSRNSCPSLLLAWKESCTFFTARRHMTEGRLSRT
jgi:hypothetical protein